MRVTRHDMHEDVQGERHLKHVQKKARDAQEYE